MSKPTMEPRDPAYRAANAARVMGVLITVIAGLILFAGLFAVAQGSSINAIWMLGAIALFYGGPGVALLALSDGVKRGSKGPTIAVLVIGCLIAGFVCLALSAQLYVLLSTGLFVPMMSLPLAVLGIFATASILMTVYCIQSLRFPDRINPMRGFEPILNATPAAPAVAPIDEDDLG